MQKKNFEMERQYLGVISFSWRSFSLSSHIFSDYFTIKWGNLEKKNFISSQCISHAGMLNLDFTIVLVSIKIHLEIEIITFLNYCSYSIYDYNIDLILARISHSWIWPQLIVLGFFMLFMEFFLYFWEQFMNIAFACNFFVENAKNITQK